MNTFRTVLFALPLVVAAALTGCAASSGGEDTADATGAASVSAPITLANYVSHPKIKAIRDQVQAIDAMALTKATNPGCDGSNDKFTDTQGRLRKLVSIGGEGGFEGRLSVYYNEAGKAIFAFNKEADWTGEKTNGATDKAMVTESRTYFDAASGKTLFQAIRTGIEPNLDGGLATPDRLATGDEVIADSSFYADPAAWFAETGCPKPDNQGTVEEPGKP
jgi:hypothetical protein